MENLDIISMINAENFAIVLCVYLIIRFEATLKSLDKSIAELVMQCKNCKG
ncbi:YvrJ family protein [Peptoniphilus sp. KCTC 25270]|uniref:YvrJ family protein n=1 Tax=Peptoniphilus sp. KCTC 25270 TaxID=2897414 RepID=UPI001E44D59A|nr:YvrJ family protein [Peptoniphilus sp. KCTC 25270]MCD1147768.1 YvrJ family protein [Peptoniphilus sp. KCTC 25270]